MNALTTPRRDQRAGDPVLEDVADRTGWRRFAFVLGPLLFSLPFMILAFLPKRHGYVSAEHSYAIFDALLAKEAGQLEQLGQNSAPLVGTFAYLFPSLFALRVLAALAAGAATWVVWRQLAGVRLSPGLRALLLAGFATSPAMLFLSDAAASQMITLLLLLVAWRLYLRFATFGVTWSGFAAGLVLALAFFCDFTSILYVIPFAVAAPRALFRGVRVHPDDRFRAAVTGFLVIALPAIFALIAWCYATWILSGNPFGFSDQVPLDGTQPLFTGAQRAVDAFVGDMVRVPLYPLVALALLSRNRRTLLAYLFPLVLTTVLRLAGYSGNEAFTLATYHGFALIGVIALVQRWPQRLRMSITDRAVRDSIVAFLIVAGSVQLTVNLSHALRSPEPQAWRSAILDGRTLDSESTSAEVGKVLAGLRSDSVLADENAYKVIARHGTIDPYVMPSDARFELARSAPHEWVDHILVNTSPSAYDKLSQDFNGEVSNFSTDFEWPGWRLLTKTGAAPIHETLVEPGGDPHP
jgi:hypothetical protein